MSSNLISRIEKQIRETLQNINIRFNIDQELMLDGIDQDMCIRLTAESIATEQLHMNESAGNIAVLGAIADWITSTVSVQPDYFEPIPEEPKARAENPFTDQELDLLLDMVNYRRNDAADSTEMATLDSIAKKLGFDPIQKATPSEIGGASNILPPGHRMGEYEGYEFFAEFGARALNIYEKNELGGYEHVGQAPTVTEATRWLREEVIPERTCPTHGVELNDGQCPVDAAEWKDDEKQLCPSCGRPECAGDGECEV